MDIGSLVTAVVIFWGIGIAALGLLYAVVAAIINK